MIAIETDENYYDPNKKSFNREPQAFMVILFLTGSIRNSII